MGVSYGYYLGPYARCNNPQVEKKVQRRTCSNDSCKNSQNHHDSKKFCSDCGSAYAKREVLETWPRVDLDCVEDLDEDLFEACGNYGGIEEDVDHWLPNKTMKGITRETHFGRDDLDEIVVKPEMIESEIQSFMTTFIKALKIIREKYGEDNVEIRWGLVTSHC